MLSALFAAIILIHLTLFSLSFRWADSGDWRVIFLRIMLLAMAWDNLTVLSGQWLSEAPFYEWMNRIRFAAHVLILPFLTLFAASLLADTGTRPGGAGWFKGFCLLFTLVALAYGVWHDIVQLQLEGTQTGGLYRLTSVSKIPPIATIATNLLLLPLAILLWRNTGWPWLFAGALFIFGVNGAGGAQPWGFIAGNLAEVVFVSSLLLTARRFSRSRLDGEIA